MTRDKIIEAVEAAAKAAAAPQISEGIGAFLRKFCDSEAAGNARHYLHAMPGHEWSALVDALAEDASYAALKAALPLITAATPGLSDVLDGKATIIPNKIGKEDAEGIWEAAYNVWAEFGASDAEAGQAAHDAAIHISPYRKEPDHGPV